MGLKPNKNRFVSLKLVPKRSPRRENVSRKQIQSNKTSCSLLTKDFLKERQFSSMAARKSKCMVFSICRKTNTSLKWRVVILIERALSKVNASISRLKEAIYTRLEVKIQLFKMSSSWLKKNKSFSVFNTLSPNREINWTCLTWYLNRKLQKNCWTKPWSLLNDNHWRINNKNQKSFLPISLF